MVWGCFSSQRIGPIHKVDGIMDRFLYKEILQNIMLPHAQEEMPLKWTFQHDNDPKHTAKIVKNCVFENKINVLKWPAQSPYFNPIQNQWEIEDSRIQLAGCKNKDSPFVQTKIAWKSILQDIIKNLI